MSSYYEEITKDWITCQECGDRYMPGMRHTHEEPKQRVVRRRRFHKIGGF